MNKVNLDIVVVTYNRLEKLKRTLSCYGNQTASFRNIIVVNNCSTDGTAEFLNNWKNEPSNYYKHVINTTENLGGSGGFYIGQEFVLKLNPDWIFLADDDAYPEQDMVEQFYRFLSTNKDDYSSICATVLNPDSTICYAHRSKVLIKKGTRFELSHSTRDDYTKPYFDLDVFSYVGPFINCQALNKVGLVNKDFFIYADDGDHSLRLRSIGRIICVPSIKIVHDSGEQTEKASSSLASWRDYYRTRNYLYMLVTHYKRCVPYRILLSLREVIKAKNLESKKMFLTAICHGLFGKLGKHNVYKPGWSAKNR